MNLFNKYSYNNNLIEHFLNGFKAFVACYTCKYLSYKNFNLFIIKNCIAMTYNFNYYNLFSLINICITIYSGVYTLI